ncbi:MAG: MBL fold metallo-hydrolase [Desulfurococcales archaeon]|nr:MBL fold metallo-hydrolase [Desulfurococcales archaeon]
MDEKDGITRIKARLPIKSLGTINVYAHRDGWLIDAGMLYPLTLLDLSKNLRQLGLTMCGLQGVVLTHFHVDHSTAAVLLAENGVEEIMIGARDAEVIEGGVDTFVDAALKIYIEHGAPKDEIERIRSNHPAIRLLEAYRFLEDVPFRKLREGDLLEIGNNKYKVLETPGHTPGSIVLLNQDTREAFVGDTMLPGITPHVTIHDWETNPLGEYLETLKRLSFLEIKTAYPGHRNPLKDPQGRAIELIEHHEARLREIVNLIWSKGPMTGYEIAKHVKWRVKYKSWDEYPPPEKFFALGEALAHLRHLEELGMVEEEYKNGKPAFKIAK